MPVGTPSSVRRQIAERRPDLVYLLQGGDDVEKAALAAAFNELVDEELRAFNVERIHAGDLVTGDRLLEGVASLLAAARTLPMMAPWRVVIVVQAEAILAPRRESEAAARAAAALEAYLREPERQTVLVLVAGDVIDRRGRLVRQLGRCATVVDCGVIEDRGAAAEWIRARVADAGMAIEPAAADLLAARAGTDVKRLRAEADRLLLYALGQRTITVADVRETAGPAALQNDWDLVNAVEQGRPADALRELALLLDAGAAPEKILGQLGWLVRTKFPGIAPGHLAASVDALFRADLDLKGSGGDPRILLERLVVELSDRRRRPGAS